MLAIVEGCTDSDTKEKPEWRPRKEAYLRHLADAPDDVLRVVRRSPSVERVARIKG